MDLSIFIDFRWFSCSFDRGWWMVNRGMVNDEWWMEGWMEGLLTRSSLEELGGLLLIATNPFEQISHRWQPKVWTLCSWMWTISFLGPRKLRVANVLVRKHGIWRTIGTSYEAHSFTTWSYSSGSSKLSENCPDFIRTISKVVPNHIKLSCSCSKSVTCLFQNCLKIVPNLSLKCWSSVPEHSPNCSKIAKKTHFQNPSKTAPTRSQHHCTTVDFFANTVPKLPLHNCIFFTKAVPKLSQQWSGIGSGCTWWTH